MIDNICGAWLTLNRNCNLHCNWCYAQNAKHGASMDLEKAIKCVNRLLELNINHITLIGGEPTIYNNIFELIKYIKDRNIHLSMATNGIMFSEKEYAQRIVDSKLDGINISIKGSSEEDYLLNTNSVGFNRMVNGYKNLVSYNFRPSLSYVIATNNLEELNSLIKALEKNDLDNIIFQFVKPIVKEDTTPIMSMYDMADVVSFLYNRMKTSSIMYKIEISFPLCIVKKDTLNALIKEKRITTCCHIQSGRGIVFDCDFKVLPCNHFIDLPFEERELHLDHKEEIEVLWDSKTVQDFRKKVRSYPSYRCEKCNLWDICGGGCFTRWFYEDPNIFCKGGFN